MPSQKIGLPNRKIRTAFPRKDLHSAQIIGPLSKLNESWLAADFAVVAYKIQIVNRSILREL